jgi:hypothetical protein
MLTVNGQIPPELTDQPIELLDLNPIHAQLRKEQKGRIYIEGCEVIETSTVLTRQQDVVAVKPFFKSKTGPTIEFQFASSSTIKPHTVQTKVHLKGRTTRFVLLDWQNDVTLPPFHATNYRGRKIMAMVNGREIINSPRIWSLTYTLFYSFNSEPKPWQ